MQARSLAEYVAPQNAECWALGHVLANGRFSVRRIVWGQVMAKAEMRQGEEARKATLYVRKSVIPR